MKKWVQKEIVKRNALRYFLMIRGSITNPILNIFEKTRKTYTSIHFVTKVYIDKHCKNKNLHKHIYLYFQINMWNFFLT